MEIPEICGNHTRAVNSLLIVSNLHFFAIVDVVVIIRRTEIPCCF